MKCRDIREELSAYLDGELEAGFSERVNTHLEGCESCRRELDALKTVTGVLHELPQRPAPQGIDREVVTWIERDMLLRRPGVKERSGLWRVALNGVALAAAAVLLAVGLYLKFAPTQEPATLDTLARTDDKSGAEPLAKAMKDAPADQAGRGVDALFDKKGPVVAEGTTPRKEPAFTTVLEGGMKELMTKNGETEKSKLGTVLEPSPAVAGTSDTAAKPRPEGMPVFSVKKAVDEVTGRPEVLELVLTTENFAEARNHIVTVASNLDIRAVGGYRSYEFGVVAGPVRDAEGKEQTTVHAEVKERLEAAEDTRRGEETARAKTAGEAAPAVVAKEDAYFAIRQNLRKVEENIRHDLDRAGETARSAAEYEATVTRAVSMVPGAKIQYLPEYDPDLPVVILAVPEPKLPQLVAKLAARPVARGNGKDLSYDAGVAAVTTPAPSRSTLPDERAPRPKTEDERRTRESTVTPAVKPDERTLEKTETTPADVAAPAAKPKPGEKPAAPVTETKDHKEEKMVYLHVYLRLTEAARKAALKGQPAAVTQPAPPGK